MSDLTFGKYQILECLGEGGIGRVYRATHPDFPGRDFAVKVFNPHLSGTEEFRDSFLREAGILSLVKHPGVLKLIEYGDNSEGLYLVMEFIKGKTLEAVLGENSVRPPLDVVLEIVRQVASALEHIHFFEVDGQQVSILHGDLSLQNIMIDERNDSIRLCDFGIARIVERGTSLRVRKPIIGNPWFISPEHMQGLWADVRSDIYSLGIIMYDLIVSARKYDEDLASLINLAKNAETFDRNLLETVPEPVGSILEKMIRPDPTERYQDVQELLKDINSALALMKPAPFQKYYYEAQLRKLVDKEEDDSQFISTRLRGVGEPEKFEQKQIAKKEIPRAGRTMMLVPGARAEFDALLKMKRENEHKSVSSSPEVLPRIDFPGTKTPTPEKPEPPAVQLSADSRTVIRSMKFEIQVNPSISKYRKAQYIVASAYALVCIGMVFKSIIF